MLLGMEYRMTEVFEQAGKEELTTEPNVYYWSRTPGKFVNKLTGKSSTFPPVKKNELVVVSETVLETTPKTVVRVLQEKEVAVLSPGPQFHGTIREWYETLSEVITDAGNTLFRQNFQFPNVLEVSPEILTILEHTIGYRAKYVPEGAPVRPRVALSDGEFVGTLNNRFSVVRVDNMPRDEARVVLITEFKAELAVNGKSVNDPVQSLLSNEVKINMSKLPNGSCRLAEWKIKVLDVVF